MFIACGFLCDSYKRWPSVNKTKQNNGTHVNNCLVFFSFPPCLSLFVRYASVLSEAGFFLFQISTMTQPMDFQSHSQVSKCSDILVWFFLHSISLFEWQMWHSNSSSSGSSKKCHSRYAAIWTWSRQKQSPLLSLHIAHMYIFVYVNSSTQVFILLHTVYIRFCS